jgi:hypothetical protein
VSGTTLVAAVALETVAAVAALATGWCALGTTSPLTFAVAALAGAALFALLYGRRRNDGHGALRPRALAIFALTLAAASFAEEVLWRGAAFGYLTHGDGSAVAFGGSTLGFALAHVAGQGWPGFRVHLLTGALFALVLLASGHLIDAIAAHAAYNFSLFFSVRNKGGSVHESVLA